jgi:hypothetical protein
VYALFCFYYAAIDAEESKIKMKLKIKALQWSARGHAYKSPCRIYPPHVRYERGNATGHEQGWGSHFLFFYRA